MYKQFYSIKTFFISILLSIGIGISVKGQTVVLSQENLTTGGDGANASLGDILLYRITTTNSTPFNITGSTIYGNIPAGTAYVAESATLNGVAVADVNGKMPFGSGGLINSPVWGAGILAPGATATIAFRVLVGTNGGTITNDATLQGSTTSGTVLLKSNSVSTNVDVDQSCSIVFQSTSQIPAAPVPNLYPYRFIRTVGTIGVGIATIYTGGSGLCYNAVTGAALPAGSVLTNTDAMAYAPASGRLYFVNNTTNAELCYVNVNNPAAYKYVGYPLETNTAAGYNINRMAYCADGYGYALTANLQDLIRFSIDPSTNLPAISRLGALVNDVNNGANDVLNETSGDIFGDGSGKLYLLPTSGKLYKIDLTTLVATYLGTISGMSPGTTTSVAIDKSGNVYIGGAYQAVYMANLTTMSAAAINISTSNVWKTGDYASCAFPVLAPVLNVTKTYTNTSGAGYVRAGDPIEYTIEVSNTGNFNAALVKLFDSIPANSNYVPGSTTMNGIAVADIGGAMPFSGTGGKLINSAAESAGIIKPGDDNKVVIKFSVTTAEYTTVCNRSTVTYPDAAGNTRHVFSDDPAQPGAQDATCFYSDSAVGARVAVNGSHANKVQPALIISVQVRPNPFINDLNLQVQLPAAENIQVRLIDFYGRTVYATSRNAGAGVNSLKLPVPAGLARGIYVLEVLAGNNRLVNKKLIKQ